MANRRIPLVDFANNVVMVGAPYAPALLDNHNWRQIVEYIHSNGSVGAQIEACANMITAAVCSIDDGGLASVCGSQALRAYSNRGSPADFLAKGPADVSPRPVWAENG